LGEEEGKIMNLFLSWEPPEFLAPFCFFAFACVLASHAAVLVLSVLFVFCPYTFSSSSSSSSSSPLFAYLHQLFFYSATFTSSLYSSGLCIFAFCSPFMSIMDFLLHLCVYYGASSALRCFLCLFSLDFLPNSSLARGRATKIAFSGAARRPIV
jgi:hypothetical protein